MTGKDNKNLPYNLENLSIPELEALLQRDFLASDSVSPDVDYIMEIVEVIQKKEQAQPGYQPLDTAKAWEEFKDFYITEEGRENSIYRVDKEDTFRSETVKPAPKHKKSKTFRRCLWIAACLCLLVSLTCIPVFGYHNFIQMLATWTAEQFGFYLPAKVSPDPEQVPEEFKELQEIMQELGADLIIPRFPEGFEAIGPTLNHFSDVGKLQFSIMYQRKNDYYLFSVNSNDEQFTHRYEKSDSLVETKRYNGIEHYYLENYMNCSVAWYVGNMEYCIVTNKTISDLKEILESTYNK